MNLSRPLERVYRPIQRREMAETAVERRGVSIALACRAFGVSETCYRYSPKPRAAYPFLEVQQSHASHRSVQDPGLPARSSTTDRYRARRIGQSDQIAKIAASARIVPLIGRVKNTVQS